MSDTTDMIHEGVLCMCCMVAITDHDGEPIPTGFPIFCRDCFFELPFPERLKAKNYWDEKSACIKYFERTNSKRDKPTAKGA